MGRDIKLLISLVGGQSALARALDVSPSRVWNWLHRDGKIPSEYVIRACARVQWRIIPHHLAPTVYPNPSDGIPPKIFSRISNSALAEEKAS